MKGVPLTCRTDAVAVEASFVRRVDVGLEEFRALRAEILGRHQAEMTIQR